MLELLDLVDREVRVLLGRVGEEEEALVWLQMLQRVRAGLERAVDELREEERKELAGEERDDGDGRRREVVVRALEIPEKQMQSLLQQCRIKCGAEVCASCAGRLLDKVKHLLFHPKHGIYPGAGKTGPGGGQGGEEAGAATTAGGGGGEGQGGAEEHK